VLTCGLFVFEDRDDMPVKLISLALLCNLLYWLAIRTFPLVEITSPSFLAAILLFLLHNYIAFDHFSHNYFEFYKVLCYLTIFCWLVPIILLLSCSANDNVLPTTFSSSSSQLGGSSLMNNYFDSTGGGRRGGGRKIGLLSFFRMVNQNYLPTIQSSDSSSSSYNSARQPPTLGFNTNGSPDNRNNSYATTTTTSPTNRKYY
jgi:hypothetical protein